MSANTGKDRFTVPDEDDWSSTSNHLLRKRIQNRVAQQNHRRRLKRKVEELERQVAKNSTSNAIKNGPNTSSVSFGPSSPNHSFSNEEGTSSHCCHHPRGDYNALHQSFGARSANCAPQQEHSIWGSQGPQQGYPNAVFSTTDQNHSKSPVQAFMNSDHSAAQYLGAPIVYENSVPENKISGILHSFATNSESDPYLTHPGEEVSPRSNTLRNSASKLLTSRIDGRNLDYEAMFAAPEADLGWNTFATSNNSEFLINSPVQTSLPMGQVLTPPESCASSHYLATEADSRLSRDRCVTTLSQQRPSNNVSRGTQTRALDIPKASLVTAGTTGRYSVGPNSNPIEKSSLAERLSYVSACATSAGFDGLENLFSAFYISDLSSSHSLSSQQRLSRKRRLPGILADLRAEIPTWTQWEAQGCKDEFLRSAESILIAEYKGLISSQGLQACLKRLSGDAAADQPSLLVDQDIKTRVREETIARTSKVLQNEVSLIDILIPQVVLEACVALT